MEQKNNDTAWLQTIYALASVTETNADVCTWQVICMPMMQAILCRRSRM